MNHLETSCTSAKPQKTSLFTMDSGFFFPPRDNEDTGNNEDSDNEWGTDEL